MEQKKKLAIAIDSIVTLERVAQDIAAISDWMKHDSKATNILYQMITKKLLKNMMDCSTLAMLWNKFIIIYNQRATENMHHLQEEFYRCNMESNESIVDFLGNLKIINSQLRGLENHNFDDSAVMTKVLCNLPNYMNYFCCAWDNVLDGVEKNLDLLTTRLLTQKGCLKVKSRKSTKGFMTKRGNLQR